MEFRHTSVLLGETIEYLQVKPDGTYVDGTLGGGGHAHEVLARLGEGGRLVGIDQDEAAILAASERLAPFGDKATIVRGNYGQMKALLGDMGISAVDGIVLDLGVSSYQLDDPERGFTYRDPDALLDMRMDRRQGTTARDLVNGLGEQELCRILRDYGEERFARNIARRIVSARADKPIETTGELEKIVKAAIPAKARQTGGHPARRTFQALRIALNRELSVLEDSLDEMVSCLKPGGRICIITFHSLEDRIVKNGFRRNEDPCTCPKDFPVCVCGAVSRGHVVTKKPVLPSEQEIEGNPRSRSAKLRVFEHA